MSTVAEVIGRQLAADGVAHIFGVVGSGNFTITNAMRAAGVPFTASRHEGGAATMADAFSRMSGQLAAVSVHQGCGLTNAGTGISEAAKSRTPLLVLAPETAPGSLSNFAMHQGEYAESILASTVRVESVETALADARRAVELAVRERRTVVLNLPLPVLNADAESMTTLPGSAELSPGTVEPSASSVHELAEVLRVAKRPVFIAGRGGRRAAQAIASLADASGALLATSAVAKGLFNGNDYNLGISGGFSSPTTAQLITEADLIVAFGCALNMWTARHGKLIGESTVLAQVDVEESALGLHRPINIGVHGDSATVAAAVEAELRVDANFTAPLGYRTPEVRERIASSSRWNDVATEHLSTPERIDPRVLTNAVNNILPAERVVAIDSGNFMGYPSQYLDVPDEFGFCFTQAFQSIGLGLYTAIGAALAQPQRMPVLGTGDGGFMMGIQELDTAVRLGLPLVAIVYNDSAYSAEVHHFGDADMSTVTFPETDIAAIARGFGATGITVRSVADLEPLREWVASGPTAPIVIDAKIASDGGSWWLAEAFTGH